MHDPRLLAIAEAERQLFEADYDDYNGTSNSGTAFCRSAALIVSLTTISTIVIYYCVLQFLDEYDSKLEKICNSVSVVLAVDGSSATEACSVHHR